jgi:hypothetical protein
MTNLNEYRDFIHQQVASSGVPIDPRRLSGAIVDMWAGLLDDPDVSNHFLPVFFVNARHDYRRRVLVFEDGDFDAPLAGAIEVLEKGGKDYMTSIIRRFVHPDHMSDNRIIQRALDMAKVIILAARERENYPPDAYAIFIDSAGEPQGMTMTTRIAKELIH